MFQSIFQNSSKISKICRLFNIENLSETLTCSVYPRSASKNTNTNRRTKLPSLLKSLVSMRKQLLYLFSFYMVNFTENWQKGSCSFVPAYPCSEPGQNVS